MNKCAAVRAVTFALALALSTTSIAADKTADVTDMQALRNAVRADKKAYVASVLNLTPDEAKKFWPAYDAYQRTLDMTGREKNVTIIEVVGSDKPVSDLYAKQIAKDIMLADDAEAKARRTLYNRVMKAVPPKKAVRYLQLENKIRAVQAYEVAETIPLIR
jgi:Spy/CpxP family protein refolding chaperone